MSVDHGDVARKFSVQHAAKSLGGWLAGRGATVEFLHLPDGDGAKTGLDDFLAVGNTIGDVMRLVHPHLPPLRGESTESRHSDAPAPRPEFGSIDGSGVLDDIVEWHARFIRFTHDGDVFLLTLWIAHTHLSIELYTTPRLRIDSISYGSGKTTVLEHLDRLCRGSQLISTLSLRCADTETYRLTADDAASRRNRPDVGPQESRRARGSGCDQFRLPIRR